MTAAAASAVAMTGIDKRFGPVHAVRTVDFAVPRGTVRGLIGENGAGKSTLMSILYGFYRADGGSIAVGGEPVDIRAPADAIAAGIGMVHQHFMLIDSFTVIENLMLGAEGGPLVARGERAMRARLAELARDYGLAVDPDARVGDLPVGVLQRVEILKALVRGADILILDEPTAVLTPAEAGGLFALMRRLAGEGKTVIIVTHKLKEIMAVTDTVSVMRRGVMLATVSTADTSPDALAELMVGRRVGLPPAAPLRPAGPPVLEVEGLSLTDARGVAQLEAIDLTVAAGEIVGIAGVAGNGQSELLEILAGMRRPSAGTIRLSGRPVDCGGRDDPQRLRARGVRHVPEDRLRCGLVKAFAAAESALLGYVDEPGFGRGPFLDRRAVVADCAAKMAAFDVRPADPGLATALFSGGNQQKIVLAREIERAPVLLLVGQPTRGVDIGAIEQIHRRLAALRAEGKAILVVSTELDELLSLADRVLVMSGGRIIGERRAATADEGEIGLMMAGIGEDDP